ncbi:MAG: enoyl-CoA hydratase/isomerase family protein [Terriglobia bacterium]
MIETSTEGRVRRVTLNRPEKRNALNSALCGALAQAFEDAESDDAIGAILLSAKGTVFCAGMDLEEALHADSGELNRLHEIVFTQIDRLRKPVIAAVQGAALGGGLGLVVNAHIVVASPESRFGLTEIRIGLWPVLIMRSIVLALGERRATELSLTGRIFGAAEAAQYGLVGEIAENALERASAIAHAVASHSAPAIAEGLKYTRSLRGSGTGSDWERVGETGRKVRERLMTSSDFKAAASAFLAGRK